MQAEITYCYKNLKIYKNLNERACHKKLRWFKKYLFLKKILVIKFFVFNPGNSCIHPFSVSSKFLNFMKVIAAIHAAINSLMRTVCILEELLESSIVYICNIFDWYFCFRLIAVSEEHRQPHISNGNAIISGDL